MRTPSLKFGGRHSPDGFLVLSVHAQLVNYERGRSSVATTARPIMPFAVAVILDLKLIFTIAQSCADQRGFTVVDGPNGPFVNATLAAPQLHQTGTSSLVQYFLERL
jgi:hypothetical protein